MERLFKIESVYHTTFQGKNKGDAVRPKVEVTLCYHETYFSSQNGPGIRRQMVQVTLLDEAANQCQLQPGMWIVGSVSMMAYPSRNPQEQGRMMMSCYLDRYVPITNWEQL